MPRDLLPFAADEAAHCRRLATGAVPYDVAVELEQLADELDLADAAGVASEFPSPVVSEIELRRRGNGAGTNGPASPASGAAGFLRDLARFFVAAARSATDNRAQRYSAERAFELAQHAERINRRDRF